MSTVTSSFTTSSFATSSPAASSYRALVRRLLLLVACVLPLAGGLGGCAATAEQAASPPGLHAATGVWTYETTGSRYLTRGTLRLALDDDGRLRGTLRDARLGTVDVDGRLRGRHLVLRIGQRLAVHGTVEGDRFTGALELPFYDVANAYGTSARQRRGGSRFRQSTDGAFYAERGSLLGTTLPPIDCGGLRLYEATDPC
jgi:hypothetical protein